MKYCKIIIKIRFDGIVDQIVGYGLLRYGEFRLSQKGIRVQSARFQGQELLSGAWARPLPSVIWRIP